MQTAKRYKTWRYKESLNEVYKDTTLHYKMMMLIKYGKLSYFWWSIRAKLAVGEKGLLNVEISGEKVNDDW